MCVSAPEDLMKEAEEKGNEIFLFSSNHYMYDAMHVDMLEYKIWKENNNNKSRNKTKMCFKWAKIM